ncbi:MAG: hypothetical protein KAT68_09590 [Bacteroidales bacterium]|nr:hypothetical protein [Bacteroidales bacterium]
MNQIFRILVLIILTSFLFSTCKFFKKEPVKITVNVINIDVYGKSNGSIKLEVSGGTPPYTYKWSNGASTNNLTNIPAGEYTVTITDKKGKTATQSISITQPDESACIDINGNIYKTVMIGKQLWMAENLKVTHAPDNKEIESSYYDDDSSNCQFYGRLYKWNIAMNDSLNEKAQGICPDGWHLPSDNEWQILIDNYTPEKAGLELQDSNGVFNCLMAGFKSKFTYHGIGSYTSFWTSTKYGNNAWKRDIMKDLPQVFKYHGKIDNSFSVRCIKD